MDFTRFHKIQIQFWVQFGYNQRETDQWDPEKEGGAMSFKFSRDPFVLYKPRPPRLCKPCSNL